MIKISNLNKKYELSGPSVLNNLNMEVPTGNFNIMIGASGCGKTTILKMISALEKPDSGELLVEGRVGMVFQSGALLPWRTVFENVKIALLNSKESEEEKDKKVIVSLENVGLANFKDKLPRELSGGQRQRVGIARALAVDSDVLLLDEPFAALDIATTYELYKDIIGIWQNSKDKDGNRKTVLMISHSIEEAVILGQQIFLIDKGRVEKTFVNDAEYPRNMKDSHFVELVESIKEEVLRTSGELGS